jgi:hypothetical protein
VSVMPRTCATCASKAPTLAACPPSCWSCAADDALPQWRPITAIRRVDVMKTPLQTQVGGQHYKDMAIQPLEYIHKNGIPFLEGNAIKYLSRWRKKGGIQDLEKARHMVDMLIQLERPNQPA